MNKEYAFSEKYRSAVCRAVLHFLAAALALSVFLLVTHLTHAQTAATQTLWVDWISSTNAPLVTGTPQITTVIGKAGTNTLTFTHITQPALAHQIGTASDVDYWLARAIYQVPGSTNAPPIRDILRMSAAGTYTLTFSEPVLNPVFAIVSLGGAAATSWDFGIQPVMVLKLGAGNFGNGTMTSTSAAGSPTNILTGKEGHGLVQFPGTITTLTWTTILPENWGGFTVGIPNGEPVPPPRPLPLVVSVLPHPLSIQLPATAVNLTLRISTAQLTNTVVPLLNSGPTIIGVPASVTIPTGQLSVTIPVTPVLAGTATVTATLNGSASSSIVTVIAPPPPPPPVVYGSVRLGWELFVVTPKIPVDANRVYRGFGSLCDGIAPLPEEIGSTTYPAIQYTDTVVPLTEARVCYEVTAVNVVGESPRSNRVVSLIGVSKPGIPMNMRIVPTP